MTDVDAVKVLLISIQTLELFARGAFTAGVAFVFAFAKWTQTQRSSPAADLTFGVVVVTFFFTFSNFSNIQCQ